MKIKTISLNGWSGIVIIPEEKHLNLILTLFYLPRRVDNGFGTLKTT
jgi:hypothetical protein